MSENSTSDTTTIFADSGSFFEQLSIDIKNARNSVAIQCMSFEADEVGCKLIELLESKPNIDRTLLIDSYSRFVVNDTFLMSPFGLFNKNGALTERIALNPLLKKASHCGVKVKFTNPMGWFLRKYPARNHKKLVLIDEDISYLGGMNFTEHNFAWSDLMIRHHDPATNRALNRSFQADLSETNVEPVLEIDSQKKLFILHGRKTKSAFQEMLTTIKKAKKVVAISPYISYPVLDAISKIPDNIVILPKRNNKGYVSFLHSRKRYKNINYIYAGGEMVHMKLIVLDDETVLYGSSNFDTISYLFEQELILQNSDPELVRKLNQVTTKLISQ